MLSFSVRRCKSRNDARARAGSVIRLARCREIKFARSATSFGSKLSKDTWKAARSRGWKSSGFRKSSTFCARRCFPRRSYRPRQITEINGEIKRDRRGAAYFAVPLSLSSPPRPSQIRNRRRRKTRFYDTSSSSFSFFPVFFFFSRFLEREKTQIVYV